MAFTPKSLAAGKLPTSLTTLYTVTSPVAAVRIPNLIIANPGTTGTYSGQIYIQPASLGITTSHLVLAAGALTAGQTANAQTLVLSQNDKIQGISDTANAVDYFISGSSE